VASCIYRKEIIGHTESGVEDLEVTDLVVLDELARAELWVGTMVTIDVDRGRDKVGEEGGEREELGSVLTEEEEEVRGAGAFPESPEVPIGEPGSIG
jgi:hypothetical protein